jgi:hypothetical protein
MELLSPMVLRRIASSVRSWCIVCWRALSTVQVDLLFLLRLLKYDSVDFINVNLELFGTLFHLRFSLFFCVLLWFLIALAFNFDFIPFFIFSFQLLFIVFILVESEKVLYGLTLANGWRKICKAIAKEDWVAPIMEYVLSDHLL